jgi:phage shock protein PspC (stress-responsive transcriptional regulator)
VNEITNIHLGRQAFTIAVDAHKALQEYLLAIKHEVGERGKDVVDEVEIRMSELLLARGISGDKVVLLADVEYLKEQLGLPKDFSEEGEEAPAGKQPEGRNGNQPKRLFRDTEHGMIGGVAAGLATYLGIDPVIVRIGFILLTIAWGWGVLAYIILWLIIPEATSSSNRLQMKGKAVTVANIKNAVHQADVPGATQRAGRTFGRVIEKMGVVLLSILGVGFVLAGVGLFLGAMTLGMYTLLNGGQVNDAIVFPVGASEVALLLCAMITVIVLAVLVLAIGVAMVRRKWPLPGWAGAALIGLFLVGGSLGTALGFRAAPHIADRVEGMRRTETVAVSEFKSVTLRGNDTRFIFVPSDKYSLKLSYISKDAMSDRMTTTTSSDGTLTIDTAGFSPEQNCHFICLYNDHHVEVTVYAPSLAAVNLDGVDSSFESDHTLRQKDMTLISSKLSFMRVEYINPEKIVVLDDAHPNAREVRLIGIRPSALRNDRINTGEDFITATRTDTFDLTTGLRCDPNEPLVYLDITPTIDLKINGISGLQAPGILEGRQNAEDYNAFNCVMISGRAL